MVDFESYCDPISIAIIFRLYFHFMSMNLNYTISQFDHLRLLNFILLSPFFLLNPALEENLFLIDLMPIQVIFT